MTGQTKRVAAVAATRFVCVGYAKSKKDGAARKKKQRNVYEF